MSYFYNYLSMIVGAVCTLIALTAMQRREKHNIGNLGWLAMIMLTPPVGLILFIIFSGKKISAEHDERETVDLPQPDEAATYEPDSIADVAVKRGLPPPSENNRLVVRVTPESMHHELFEVIESAQRRLFIHSFILIDDAVGRSIIDRLCEKAEAGIEVRLMVDGFGSFTFSDALLQRVIDAGGRTTRFKPISQFSRFAYLNYRNHRKLVVADGERSFIGGANLVEYEMTPSPDDETWVDYAMRIDGLAARQIESIFCSDWKFATDEELPPTTGELTAIANSDPDQSALQVIPVGPDGPPEVLDDVWLTAINRARERVWIITPYFIPPRAAIRSLAMAIRRGVDVRIIYPDHSDMAPADYGRRDFVQELHELGATLLRLPDRMVHAKLLLVDDDVAYCGSANFDMRSFFLNYELVVGVFNETKVKEMACWFEELAEKCIEGPTPDTLKRRFFGTMARLVAEQM
jgi:cardiolipin synthase